MTLREFNLTQFLSANNLTLSFFNQDQQVACFLGTALFYEFAGLFLIALFCQRVWKNSSWKLYISSVVLIWIALILQNIDASSMFNCARYATVFITGTVLVCLISLFLSVFNCSF